ncbi:MAG: B12-binding domain-containing radical SAM protein, partial [Candidatus Latescibacterota bacterium]
MKKVQSLVVSLIQPSRYDDDGYVIRYFKGVLPSNTLACLRSLTLEFADRWEKDKNVSLTVEAYDEVVERIPIGSLARRNRGNTRVVAALVGVQSNQFARASDLAKQLTASGIKTLIGGFHVSGVIAMLGEPTPEIRELMDLGVTVVHGEAEGRWESILEDVLSGTEKPLYIMESYPDISDSPIPQPASRYMKKFALPFMGTVDCSRGCPFNCSFCTVVNVQGHKMRHRSGDKILATIRENYQNGISEYFFTDDNFSRNPEWEKILDGIIHMREAEDMGVTMMMQVDTRSHKIKNFTEKAARAGCTQVFIGMESINPRNLEAANKKQN